jgi:DNA helicase HerA-like ATPase
MKKEWKMPESLIHPGNPVAARASRDTEQPAARPPADLLRRLQADIDQAGGELPIDPELAGAIGATMFDLPGSEDNTVTVLLSQENAQCAPSQGLVRIKSRKTGDGRSYLGIVTAGPFAEPDSLRADSHLLVTVATRGGIYLPPYHGRVQVTILGEELADGSLTPPRLRPLPNSPVHTLSDAESAAVLRASGDIRLGLVAGYRDVVVGVPSDQKMVLPRHTAVLGTTGSGKSTTVGRFVQQAQAAGMAVILLDVEGEYTHLHEPTDNPRMLSGLADRNLNAAGVPRDRMTLYHLLGRDTANPSHPDKRAFSLQFARLSPYAAMEILDLSDAQQERFLKAYDVCKALMREVGIFPRKEPEVNKEVRADDERVVLELDEFERGYPRLTLSLLIDVAGACLARAEKPPREGRRGKKDEDEEPVEGFVPFNPALATSEGMRALQTRIHAMQVPGNATSWRALLGKLWRLHRLNVFYNENDREKVKPLNYADMLQPGRVSVIDLSDSGASELNNIVIADLLRGVQDAQDQAYQNHEKARAANPEAPPPTRTLLVIEEAHEFLSADRIDRMRVLFEQVARIAKRGRKRWLGLMFVTQLPQHLPRQVFGLVNSYILHKITDPQVVSTLQRTVSGIDSGLWARLTGLAPGQAIVSFPHMARPLLVSVDPTPAKLRLVD